MFFSKVIINLMFFYMMNHINKSKAMFHQMLLYGSPYFFVFLCFHKERLCPPLLVAIIQFYKQTPPYLLFQKKA